jgi:2-polyprenyl-3-methyl-5-hydroxy-6-metoxy-1,4-benzoquinol methylase
VFEWVRSHRPLGEIGSLVEFGAGGGWNLVPFVREGVNVRGYDLSHELIPLAESHGVEVRQGGLDTVEGEHDAILLLHVLEHLLDPVDGMRTLAARLKPDGLFFIEVPDIESFAVGQLQNAHTYYFSEKTLRHYAAQAGLTAIAFEHVEATGHMRGVFVREKNGSEPIFSLDGHYDEMAAMMRRYNREWRLRAPVRGAVSVLRRAGLEQRARKLLGR